MEGGFADAVRYVIAREKAVALGRTERRLNAALDAFRAFDDSLGRRDPASSEAREKALWELVDRFTAFVVQREACGLYDLDDLVALYGIPAEAVARIGARPANARLRPAPPTASRAGRMARCVRGPRGILAAWARERRAGTKS